VGAVENATEEGKKVVLACRRPFFVATGSDRTNSKSEKLQGGSEGGGFEAVVFCMRV